VRTATVVEHLMPADVSSIKQESSILKACCIHFINYGEHSKQGMEAAVRKLGGTVSLLSVGPWASCVASFACAALLSQVSMTTAAASAFMSFCLLAKLWHVLQHVLYVALSCVVIRVLLQCCFVHVNAERGATWLAELFQWCDMPHIHLESSASILNQTGNKGCWKCLAGIPDYL